MNTDIKHLGELKGKVLVFGGVYSNLQALEELQFIANELNISAQNIICTGDVVGYCASPSQCLDFIENWGVHVIKGNVEENLINGTDDCGCNFEEGSRCDIFSKQWFPFAVTKMTEKNMRYLQTLPDRIEFEFAGKKVHVLHGAHDNISEFVYASEPWVTKLQEINKVNADVVLAGHCGFPFSASDGDKFWLNSGVIGMPANDGTPRVWFMILDEVEGEFAYSHCNFQYDSFEANQQMLENDLPYSYAETLLSGIWDNHEILPEAEIAQEGVALSFENQIDF